MIEQALELARKRARAADAILRDETQLSLKFESGRLKENALRQEAGLNLRVFTDGRYGVAGTTDIADIADVVTRALASAEQGDALTFDLPAAGPLPVISCFDDRAAGMDVASLAAIGRSIVERLTRPGWQVNASVDRYVETTTFANTAGQAFSYRATGCVRRGGARRRRRRADGLRFRGGDRRAHGRRTRRHRREHRDAHGARRTDRGAP